MLLIYLRQRLQNDVGKLHRWCVGFGKSVARSTLICWVWLPPCDYILVVVFWGGFFKVGAELRARNFGWLDLWHLKTAYIDVIVFWSLLSPLKVGMIRWRNCPRFIYPKRMRVETCTSCWIRPRDAKSHCDWTPWRSKSGGWDPSVYLILGGPNFQWKRGYGTFWKKNLKFFLVDILSKTLVGKTCSHPFGGSIAVFILNTRFSRPTSTFLLRYLTWFTAMKVEGWQKNHLWFWLGSQSSPTWDRSIAMTVRNSAIDSIFYIITMGNNCMVHSQNILEIPPWVVSHGLFLSMMY